MDNEHKAYKQFFHKVVMTLVESAGGPGDVLEVIRDIAVETGKALYNEIAVDEDGWRDEETMAEKMIRKKAATIIEKATTPK